MLRTFSLQFLSDSAHEALVCHVSLSLLTRLYCANQAETRTASMCVCVCVCVCVIVSMCVCV